MENKISFIQSKLTETVIQYRKQLYSNFIAPLDGMWEALYIANSIVYLIKNKEEEIGYCCIDQDKSLNQLFLIDTHRYLINSVITELIKEEMMVSAQLSSIEPVLFNTCLQFSKSMEVNTLNYTFSSEQGKRVSNDILNLNKATTQDANRIRTFFKNEIGFEDSFGYTDNLIQRGEIYVVEEDNEILATGECRLSDSQPKYADVGMVVKQNNRKKGLGTSVLSELVKVAYKNNRIPICSTTVDNIASQKAIERAGFYNSHTIFKIEF